ncbi:MULTISPECIES: multidrug effflux MFS transporter [Isoptericola]|uniref:Multidrug effflux MFS transporter n=1 Tax=Isoptericola sediminis TaxID=2733572 RepID=A0A849K697_9MICO|nr:MULTISPECIES: multidrug effflux MFS transporter [Isoptericola]MDO8144371.1 multidrug effflux MFS transporter [Isoptericola sp. 178]MDO8148225.1 multidrug effflux MFS transporter [Isoptericola sp. b515]MDO8151702.1 multidrug effflux MFS transporter [Isoptericola sp. b408]NNU27960.1 multidrug effflux MFS transporter [Isoptericola sediminis]
MPEKTTVLQRARSPFRWILMLGALAALPAFTVDMYLPSLPEVADDLGSTASYAQLSVSVMLIGGAAGQLVIGPLSDRFGRRAPLVWGLALHVVTSLLCALAPTMSALIVLRLLQGFFNAACTVAAMAVVRDRFVGAEAARILSRLMLIIGVAPMLAPTFGSAVAAAAGWRWVFAVLAVGGASLAVVVWRAMPETLPAARRQPGGAGSVLRGYRDLVRDRHFMGLAVLPGLGQAVLMSYVVGSPFVFQEYYGLSHTQFSLLFALNGLGLVVSAQINAALVRRVAPIRLLRAALVLQGVFAVGLVVVARTEFGGLLGLLALLWIVLAFQGLIPANASAIALSRHGERAGSAAAVIGAVQAGTAGAVSPLVGVLGGDAVAMTTVMLGAWTAAICVLAFATPAFRRGGWVHLA